MKKQVIRNIFLIIVSIVLISPDFAYGMKRTQAELLAGSGNGQDYYNLKKARITIPELPEVSGTGAVPAPTVYQLDAPAAPVLPAGVATPVVHSFVSPAAAAPGGPAKTEKKHEASVSYVSDGKSFFDDVERQIGDNLGEILDITAEAGRRYGRYVKDFGTFVIKLFNAKSRVLGAERLRKCITEQGLDLLFVPAKMAYIYRGNTFERLEKIGDPVEIYNSFCIAEKIVGFHPKDKKINRAQAEQLCIAVKHTQLSDFCGGGNIIVCVDGRVAFIDTEECSFRGFDTPKLTEKDLLLNLLHNDDCAIFEPEACTYIQAKIWDLEEKEAECECLA